MKVEKNQINNPTNKYIFWIVFFLIYIDFIIRFNFYNFNDGLIKLLSSCGLEAIILIIAFYGNLFVKANNGIIIGIKESPKRISIKRCLILTIISSIIVTLSIWTLRFAMFFIKNIAGDIDGKIILYIYLGTFILSFIIFFISYLIAYFLAVNNNLKSK